MLAMSMIATPVVTRDLSAGVFRQMAWAFVFLGISIGPSIRVGRENFLFDVLPDFIGYLLVATAANVLLPFHHRARYVRNLSLFLMYFSIPATIQYTSVTYQTGSAGTWKSPFWPYTVTAGLLELMLVWTLCGMVAGVAQLRGDAAIEQLARSRSTAYVLLKLLLIGGSVVILISPSRDLVIGGALAGIAGGLILMGLMVGLMLRAGKMWDEAQPVALPLDPAGGQPGSRGWWFRLLVSGGVVLPIALAVVAVYYYQHWDQARAVAWKFGKRLDNYWPVQEQFYAQMLSGQLDQAYASTTADFKTRISRAQLSELAKRYAAYAELTQEDSRRGLGGGVSGPAGGDRSALQSQGITRYDYATTEKGTVVQVTLTIRFDRDSIFRRSPPPLKVDDFKVEEKAAPDSKFSGYGGRPSHRE